MKETKLPFGEPERSFQGKGVETIEHGLPAELLASARKLRKCQTDAEALLWQLVRNRQLRNWKFRRQHPISPGYILDFYCVETKVAVEVDSAGHSHKSQYEYDADRTASLLELGIRVIRFSNEEVLEHPGHVLRKIIHFSSS